MSLQNQIFAVQPGPHSNITPFDQEKLLGRLEMKGSIPIPGADELWQAYGYSSSGLMGMVVGKPVSLQSSRQDEEFLKESGLTVVKNLASQFGFAYAESKVAQILHGRGTTTVLVNFFENSVEVYGAFAAVTLNKHGELVSIKGRGYGSTIVGDFKFSADELANEVIASLEYVGTTLTSSSYVWYPIASNDKLTLRAACQIVLSHDNPAIQPVLFVDAGSGEVLSAENRVVYDNLPGVTRGSYRPFRPADRPVVGVFPEEIVTLNGGQQIFSGLDGTFNYNVNPGAGPFQIRSELRGRWVDVEYEDGADASFSRQLNRIEPVAIEWTRDNSRDDERMLYYHTNMIHAFWKDLDANFRGMDRVIPATCEYGDNYDNAFWNGQGMFFGNGQNLGNLALKGDVIHHEFGHGVTGSIYPWNILPYEGESGALNEAWSDYFPCSISDEPYMGESAPGGAGAMRNLDNDLVYPRDWFGEVHYDSRMVSAAMWHSRAVLGNGIANPLFHSARYELGNTFLSYFTDVLITDDNDGDITNGTPHGLALYEQFGRHGIGPGIFPKIDFTHTDFVDQRPGDRDNIWEPGETVEIALGVWRDGSLYPPPAENVTIRLTCDHQSVQILNNEVNLGSLYVGDTTDAESLIRFAIADDAPLSFATLYLTVSADDFAIITIDTIRIALGHPSLLLVRDAGEGDDRSIWYRNSLDEIGVIYSEFSVATPTISLDDLLGQFPSIIWFTGDAREGFLSNINRSRISDFIDEGGNFALTGQSIAKEMRGTRFLEDNFGATVLADSVTQHWVEGVEGDPIGRGLQLLMLGSQGANNQRRPATIEAVGDGIECFHWTRLPNQPAAGIRMEHRDSGAKTLFFSFGIEAIGGHGETDQRDAMLASILDWFAVEHSVAEPGSAPFEFSFGNPYPNPFNGTVTLPFTVNNIGELTYSVFDISGRELIQGNQQVGPGDNLLSLNASGWGSGYYFVKLTVAGVTTSRRVLLVR